MTASKTEAPMYLVPGDISRLQFECFAAAGSQAVGAGASHAQALHAGIRAISTLIGSCESVETAACIRNLEDSDELDWLTFNNRLLPDGEWTDVVRRIDMDAQVTALNRKIAHLKSCLTNIRETCLQAAEGPTPANSMVSAGLRAMHLADAALNGEERT